MKVLLDGPNTAGPIVAYPPILPCVPAMGSIVFPVLAGTLNSTYDNFAYNGPFNPGIGWGMHFEGSVPLYADPQKTIINGRASTAVSLRGVSDLLQRVRWRPARILQTLSPALIVVFVSSACIAVMITVCTTAVAR